MKKFILIYSGKSGMGSTEEEIKMITQKWNEWFSSLGANLVDGGFPFMPNPKMTNGKEEMESKSELTGYSIVKAENYAKAMEMAMSCPVNQTGQMVNVFEEQPM